MFVRFSKYQGIGNDFILIDATGSNASVISGFTSDTIKTLCRRRYGIGADGIIFLTESVEADFGMKLFNSDGSSAELSGNGLRCLALFTRETNNSDKKEFSISTDGGVGAIKVLDDNIVRVEMPPPKFNRSDIPMRGEGECVEEELIVDDRTFIITALSTGNPHCVIFDDFAADDIENYGPKIESHKIFPERVNAGFAEILSPDSMKLTVFERGACITDACGSGAAAAVCAGIKTGRFSFNSEVKVLQRGGELTLLVTDEFAKVYLTGEALKVFSGEVRI